MAAAPLPPVPVPAPPPESTALSEGARIIDTFITPSRTFTDLRRSAAWWAPWLLTTIFSLAFFYVVGQKIGFHKVAESQIQASQKAAARIDNLPADQRDRAIEQQGKGIQYFGYAFPLFILLINLIIAAVLFATFKFGAGADLKFGASFAVVMYAGLPGILKSLLAMISIMAGASADSFSLQNPVATNPAYFMTPGDSPFLYSLMSSLDVFLIWTLVLSAIGFTCVAKVKRGTSFGIVFGWWVLFTLIGAAIGSAFS
jgi:hypothetical protein